jgi:hypothetical protein
LYKDNELHIYNDKADYSDKSRAASLLVSDADIVLPSDFDDKISDSIENKESMRMDGEHLDRYLLQE